MTLNENEMDTLTRTKEIPKGTVEKKDEEKRCVTIFFTALGIF